MNLSKSLEYFDPINDVTAPVHVIGVGAMGSRVVELLVRLGIPKIHIWDMDIVEDKNITNQLYFTTQIGMKKTAESYDRRNKNSAEIGTEYQYELFV